MTETTKTPAMDPAEIIATLRESLLVLTDDLRVDYASDRFLMTFDVDRAAILGRPLAELGDGQWNVTPLLEALRRMADEGGTIEDFEVEHTFEHIGRRVMRLNARRAAGASGGILLAIDDVTEAAERWRELGRLRRLAQGIVDTLREPLLVLDGRLDVIEASRAFYRTFRVDAAETIGRNLADLGQGQWANEDLIHLLTEIIPDGTILEDHEITHAFPGIGTRTFMLNARKIYREGNNTRTLLLAMEDVTEWRRMERDRERALARSGHLLEELNHRVMNSLSMIGSVITMEGRALSDEECRSAFKRMSNRIAAIGTLYRNLSRAAAVDSVKADAYLGAVLNDTVTSLKASSGSVDLDLAIADVPLSTRMAVPLGLIVNELATNSLKYAFRGRDGGTLGLHLAVGDGGLEMSIWDDGSGIDPEARVDSGLGQKLVTSFIEQLGGTLDRDGSRGGTRHILRIPHAEITRLNS